MKPYLQTPLVSLAGMWLLASVIARGQATSTSSTETGELPKTVELSPFVVNADGDVGYQATNTLAGSRLNTSLKDTAASISVMTAEFLSDIGATDVTEALEWGNNVQPDVGDAHATGASPNDNAMFGAGDRFRVRGQRAEITRNYFLWELPTDTYNVERVEETRGPNSVLFGIGSAGGIINTSTKQALTGRSFLRGDVRYDNYGSYRGTFDANLAAFNGKLAVRINGLYEEKDGFRTYDASDKRAVHAALKYNLTPSTRFRAEYETGEYNQMIPSYGVSDASSLWIAAGRPTYASPVNANASIGLGRYGAAVRVTYIGNDDRLINMARQNFGVDSDEIILDRNFVDPSVSTGGPGQLRDTDFETISAFLEQRIGDHTHVELAYNHQEANAFRYQAFDDARGLSFDPNLSLPSVGTNPHAGSLMFDGTWVRRHHHYRADNTRLSISTELDFGKWGKYRLAGMGEYEASTLAAGPKFEAWEGRPFNNNPEAGANRVFRRNYVVEGDWATYYRNGPAQLGLIRNMTDPVTGRTLSSTWVAQNQNQTDNPTHLTTFLIGAQARYFKDRLAIGVGFRKDELEFTDHGSRRNPQTNEWETDYSVGDHHEYSGRTSTLGAVYHITPRFSVLYNQSDNFSLPSTNIRLLPDDRIPGNPEGEGRDMGVAFTLLEGKLYARAVYYESKTIGAASAHGFGSSLSSPNQLTGNILDALLAEGLITDSEAQARDVESNGILYDTSSKGYEFTLTANPTKNWRLQANYSITDTFEENIGVELQAWAAEIIPYFREFPQDIVTASDRTIERVIADFELAMADQFALEGEGVSGRRKHKVNFFTRYTFPSGPLKGLYIGGGYRHQSKIVAGKRGPQGEYIHGRSWWLADALLGYRFNRVPVFDRLNVQLNIYNLFDEDRPLVTRFFDDGRVLRTLPVAPRSWRLSASVEF